jgi:predicted GIY-YIG superfamily endonuclease
MSKDLIAAFEEISDGYSPDRVIADPDLNSAFAAACEERGLTEPVRILNRQLMNLRKTGELRGPRRKRSKVEGAEECSFAAEVAIRHLERREKLTLDSILCDPALASEFDGIAAEIIPGYSPLAYRWAALSLRKVRKLRPEIVARVAPALRVERFTVDGLDPESLPDEQGLYIFTSANGVLYVGEATNLRKRLRKHLDHSDNKGLARWLWEHGQKDLHLEVHVLEGTTATLARKALEAELIVSRKPIFNVKLVENSAKPVTHPELPLSEPNAPLQP